MTSASSAEPKGSASALGGHFQAHLDQSSEQSPVCCERPAVLLAGPYLARQNERREREDALRSFHNHPVLCLFSATASSSAGTKVFLGHRQQTQPLCCSVNNDVTDEYCQNFDHLPSWQWNAFSQWKQGCSLPHEGKTAGRAMGGWARLEYEVGKGGLPSHNSSSAGWPRRSSEVASALACPFTWNVKATCVVRYLARFPIWENKYGFLIFFF